MAILGGEGWGTQHVGPQRGVWGPKSQGHSATGSPQGETGWCALGVSGTLGP